MTPLAGHDTRFRGFDFFLSIPLFLYLLIIVGLTAGVFISITPSALRTAFADKALIDAVVLSIGTSLTSTLLAVCVAVPAGYVLSRHRFPGYAVVDGILDIPIVLPPLVMGLSVLIFFSTPFGRWIDRGIWEQGLFVYQPLGIVLVQFIVGTAFAVRVIKSGFESLDPQYEQVAMTLGASPWQTFTKVVLPNVVPCLVAGAVISWARIFGLFGPVLLVCGTMRGKTEIMPTTVFLETSIGRIEVALVVGAMMILISMTTLIVFKRLGGKGYLW